MFEEAKSVWDEHRGKALPEGEQVEVCDVEGTGCFGSIFDRGKVAV